MQTVIQELAVSVAGNELELYTFDIPINESRSIDGTQSICRAGAM